MGRSLSYISYKYLTPSQITFSYTITFNLIKIKGKGTSPSRVSNNNVDI